MLQRYLEYLRSLLEKLQSANPNTPAELFEAYRLTALLILNTVGVIITLVAIGFGLAYGIKWVTYRVVFRKADEASLRDEEGLQDVLYSLRKNELIVYYCLAVLLTPFLVPTVMYFISVDIAISFVVGMVLAMVIAYTVYVHSASSKVTFSIWAYAEYLRLCREAASLICDGSLDRAAKKLVSIQTDLPLPVSKEKLIGVIVAEIGKLNSGVVMTEEKWEEVFKGVDFSKLGKFRDVYYNSGCSTRICSEFANKRLKELMM